MDCFIFYGVRHALQHNAELENQQSESSGSNAKPDATTLDYATTITITQSGLNMSLQAKEQEEILSIVNEAAKWTKGEMEANLKNCLPILNKFVSCTENFQIGLQIIRFVFGSFLPHLSLAVSSEELLNLYLPSLEKCLHHLLEEPLKENTMKTQENLEGLVLSVECCGILMKYLLHQHQQGSPLMLELISNVPSILIDIIKASLEHCLQKDQIYQNNLKDVDELLQAFFKETISGCLLLCEILMKIEWSRGTEEGMSLLAEVCEKVSSVAHHLSCLSELKGSVTAWKTYTLLVQNYSEELKRRILLITTVQFLKQEISEGLMMLHSFENNPDDKMLEYEEKVFLRVLKKCSFNLKILIIITEKFGGFLRGAHTDLLSVILSLMSSSPHGFPENLPFGFKEKIDEQLSIGIWPLLSNLRLDNDFIQEVCDWLKKEEETVLNNYSTNKKGRDTSLNFVAYLLLLITLIKLALSDRLESSFVSSLESFVLKNLFQCLLYCHAELSYPQMLPDVMHDGQAQEKTSLYAYTLMYTCAFVSVLDESDFPKAEQFLFENALSGDHWKSLFAADVLCFVSRYGSASLCESHCLLLMKVLTANPTMKLSFRRNSISLLARLLALVKPQTVGRLLCEWISDEPKNVFVAELVYECSSSLDENTQTVTDRYIMTNWKDDKELILQSGHPQTINTLFHDLDAVRLYLKSSAIKMQRIDLALLSYMLTSQLKIFRRFPSKYSDCSVVSRLFCLVIETMSAIIEMMTTEDICLILMVFEEMIPRCAPDVLLSMCDFVSSLGKKQFAPGKRFEEALKRLSGICARLLSHFNVFVHLNSIRALVTFAQVSAHEEVFASCVSQLGDKISQEVTQHLEGIVVEGEPLKLKNYLKFQSMIIYPLAVPSHPICVKIPLDFEAKGSDCEIKLMQSGANKNVSKRRKLDTNEVNQKEKTEFLEKIDEIKSILINTDIVNMEDRDKHEIKNKLVKLVRLWESLY